MPGKKSQIDMIDPNLKAQFQIKSLQHREMIIKINVQNEVWFKVLGQKIKEILKQWNGGAANIYLRHRDFIAQLNYWPDDLTGYVIA